MIYFFYFFRRIDPTAYSVAYSSVQDGKVALFVFVGREESRSSMPKGRKKEVRRGEGRIRGEKGGRNGSRG